MGFLRRLKDGNLPRTTEGMNESMEAMMDQAQQAPTTRRVSPG
jgi:hypothetical protein